MRRSARIGFRPTPQGYTVARRSALAGNQPAFRSNRRVAMADQVQWHFSGDYFENCSCTVVCPCLVSKAAPMTSRPTEGVCNVPLIFHIDSGRYGDIPLDGLNVALAIHTPGPMADGNWSVAAYIDQRADDKQTEALGAIFTGAAGGPVATLAPFIGKTSRGEQGSDHLPDRRQDTFRGNPGHPAHVRRSTADRASERGNMGEYRSPGQPRKAGVRRGSARKYLQRSRPALG